MNYTMQIELPITLEAKRPLEPPELPYRQCGTCHYVDKWEAFDNTCPGCGLSLGGGGMFWPEGNLKQLWHDEVFCWNSLKAELATVVAAFYFEASVFNLLYNGIRWFDPELHILGATYYGDYRPREARIWKYLSGIRNAKRTDEALLRVFSCNGKTMLETVLGSDVADFWEKYRRCREWRNEIAHRGRRIFFEAGSSSDRSQMEAERDQMLWASLTFVPECWVVFSRLWNEYIHKKMVSA